VTDEQITALVERLKKAANSAPGRDPDKYGAWMTVTDFQAILAHIEAQAAEIEKLAGLVQGWHYLAVGPDEMGDYHTQKALIEASEPYAHPALKAPTVFATYTGKGWVAYATEAAASAALRARAALAQETQP
jgi:hypothetical protein